MRERLDILGAVMPRVSESQLGWKQVVHSPCRPVEVDSDSDDEVIPIGGNLVLPCVLWVMMQQMFHSLY
eukprot:66926-Amphidinium_carterae.1